VVDAKQIASFVVRFQLAAIEKETGNKQWRIKVTHVQEDLETLFDSIEEAVVFMKEIAEDGRC
jgi:Lhr-like helicase